MAYLKMLLPIRNDSPNEGLNRMTLQTLEGEERLCDDFEYRLLASTVRELTKEEIDEILGNTIKIEIHFQDKDETNQIRYINGTAYRIQRLQTRPSSQTSGDAAYVYRFQVRSWLHKLTYNKACRIFQKQTNTAMSIIKEVLDELGFRENMHFLDKTDVNWIRSHTKPCIAKHMPILFIDCATNMALSGVSSITMTGI